MDEYYKNWKKALDEFKASAEKDVEEIRQCKAQMQAMKHHDVDRFCKGNFIRDDERIIISAPEIIIGDVNKEGILNGYGPSTVIIRSNEIRQEGATTENGEPGRIVQRAPIIKNVCEDPGLDGEEATVTDMSSFTVQAGGIGLLSECTQGVFVETPAAGAPGSISIQADDSVNISATVPCQERKKHIDDIIKEKKKKLDSLKLAAETQKKSVDDTLEQMDSFLDSGQKLYESDNAVRGSYLNISDLHEAIEDTAESLGLALDQCTSVLSRLAELNRQLKSLEKAKKSIEQYESNYEKEYTGGHVSITAEAASIISKDGDGKLRDNDGAGLFVQARNVSFTAHDDKGATMEKSSFNITSHDINLSTVSPKIEEKSSELPSTGNVRITSKDITIESVDYEVKDNKKPEEKSEKALTKDGKLSIRVENVDVTSYATDGKSSGTFAVNSKDITLRSLDMKVDDKGKAEDDKLAEGSKVAIISSDITAGGIDKDKQGKSVKIAFTEEISADAKTKLELKQDEGQKAAMQLADNKVDIKGDEAKVTAKTTIDGETTITKDTSIKSKTTISGNVSVSGTIDTSKSSSL